MSEQLSLFGGAEPEMDWTTPEPSQDRLESQPLPPWADDAWFNQDEHTAPNDDLKLVHSTPEEVIRRVERVYPLPTATKCQVCGDEDVLPKPLVVWMGGLVHVSCHQRLMRDRKKREREVQQPSCPRCVICGRDSMGSRIHVTSMYELAPGVKEGVCHEWCFEAVLKSRRRMEER